MLKTISQGRFVLFWCESAFCLSRGLRTFSDWQDLVAALDDGPWVGSHVGSPTKNLHVLSSPAAVPAPQLRSMRPSQKAHTHVSLGQYIKSPSSPHRLSAVSWISFFNRERKNRKTQGGSLKTGGVEEAKSAA